MESTPASAPKLIDGGKVGPDMGDDLTVIGRRNKKNKRYRIYSI